MGIEVNRKVLKLTVTDVRAAGGSSVLTKIGEFTVDEGSVRGIIDVRGGIVRKTRGRLRDLIPARTAVTVT